MPPMQRFIAILLAEDSRASTDVCDAPVWRRVTYRVPSRVPKNPRVEQALEPLVRTKSRMLLGTSAVPLARFRVIGSHPLRRKRPAKQVPRGGLVSGSEDHRRLVHPVPLGILTGRACVTHISMSEVSVAELAPARWFHCWIRLSSSPTPSYASRLLHPTPCSEEHRHEEWKHPLDQGPSFTILTWLTLVLTSLVVFWCAPSPRLAHTRCPPDPRAMRVVRVPSSAHAGKPVVLRRAARRHECRPAAHGVVRPKSNKR